MSTLLKEQSRMGLEPSGMSFPEFGFEPQPFFQLGCTIRKIRSGILFMHRISAYGNNET